MSVLGVWLGPGKPTPLAERCMDTWPEDSFLYSGRARLMSVIPWVMDIPYFREAHAAEHWAGASDVARLALLWQFGGTYLDVDVEVIDSEALARFERQAMESGILLGGMEDESWACNAVIVAPPQHEVIGALLKRYGELKLSDTFQGTVTGATLFTQACAGRRASLLPPQVFYPWHWKFKGAPEDVRRAHIKEGTVTAHYWEGSWVK